MRSILKQPILIIFPEGLICLKFSKNKYIHACLKKIIASTAKIIFKISGSDHILLFHRFYGYQQKRDAYSNMNDPEFLLQAKNSFLIVEGWRYRDKINFTEEKKDLLRKIFTPKNVFLEKVNLNLKYYFSKKSFEKNISDKNFLEKKIV